MRRVIYTVRLLGRRRKRNRLWITNFCLVGRETGVMRIGNQFTRVATLRVPYGKRRSSH